MNKKLFIVLAFTVLFSCFAFAEPLTTSDLGWFGTASVNLDKASFSSAEPITGTITLANNESYPIIGGTIVLQLVENNSGSLDESSENENIFFESSIQGIWVLPGATKKVAFSIPAQKSGSYRLDAFAVSIKSSIVGESWSLFGPASSRFVVGGQNTPIHAKINRNLTKLGGPAEASGFSVEPNAEVGGKVFVSNPTSAEKTGLKLKVVVCDWTTSPCSAPTERIFDVPPIAPRETILVEPKFNAPAIPSTYEINLILLDNNNVESIYKSRMSVAGGTAKPMKVFITGMDTKDYSLSAMVSGTQNLLDSSSFEDFSVGMAVFANAQKVDEKEVQVTSLGAGEVILKEFAISAQDFSRLCVYTKKNNNLYSEECFDAPIKEIQEAYDLEHPPLVDVKWTYDPSTKSVALVLEKEIPINAKISIFSSEKTIFEEEITGASNYSKSIFSEPANLTMTIDDFDAKRQQVFHLNLALPEEERDSFYVAGQPGDGGNLLPCGENLCGNGLVCSGTSYTASDGICCASACVPAIEQVLGLELLFLPLVFWIAIILLLLAVAIAVNLIRRKKK